MSYNQLIEEVEKKHLNRDRPEFKVGDTIRVHTKIIEGQKERIQVFTGTVIARKGRGTSETFSVYRNAYNSSMEKVFLLHSPRITKIEIERHGDVRRAKLYNLRGATGKAAKVKEKIMKKIKKVKAPVVKNEVPKEEVKEQEKPTLPENTEK
jgi:large subunit ribosomal protein L19